MIFKVEAHFCMPEADFKTIKEKINNGYSLNKAFHEYYITLNEVEKYLVLLAYPEIRKKILED